MLLLLIEFVSPFYDYHSRNTIANSVLSLSSHSLVSRPVPFIPRDGTGRDRDGISK